jgi:hypothetical protein
MILHKSADRFDIPLLINLFRRQSAPIPDHWVREHHALHPFHVQVLEIFPKIVAWHAVISSS